jgi:hypothetical protein
MYGRGDYYRGDYYRGDPGLFSFVGKAIRTVGNIVPGPVGAVAKAVGSAIAGPTQKSLAVPTMQPPALQIPDIGIRVGGPSGFQIGAFNPPPSVPGGIQGPVGTMTPQGFIQGCQLRGTRPNKSGYYKQVVKGNPANVVYIPKGSVCVKPRRLNIANPRALRRAVRRAQGFAKMARRVLTFVSAKAPKGRAKFKRKR